MVEGSDTQVSVTRPLPVDSSERRAPILTRCGITKHVISLYLPGLKSGVSREVLIIGALDPGMNAGASRALG